MRPRAILGILDRVWGIGVFWGLEGVERGEEGFELDFFFFFCKYQDLGGEVLDFFEWEFLGFWRNVSRFF